MKTLVSFLLLCIWSQTWSASHEHNPIVVENQKVGTTDWILKNPRVDAAHSMWNRYGLRCNQIEGYCSDETVEAGDELKVFVSTNPGSDFTLDIYRMGWYNGRGGRLMRSFGPIKGGTQETPEAGPNRVIECDWKSSLTIEIPDDWLSGVYLGKLTELTDNVQSYIIFVVRDSRQTDLVFQVSDMTWQAYNRWPVNHSLYCTETIDWHTGTGIDVSTVRPYGKYTQLGNRPLSTGSGEFLLWEFPFAYWLEKEGYDVSYISNWDTHYRPETLARTKGFLSIGHDEYWTQKMYDVVRKRVDNGMAAGFFSANSVFNKMKLKNGRYGKPNAIFERDGLFNPREDSLMGNRSVAPVVGGGDWICSLPDHWVFDGTGMKQGDAIPGLVGWEFQGAAADMPGLVIVAQGPTDSRRFPSADNESDLSGWYESTLYEAPKGNVVFSCATIFWGDGLSSPPGHTRSAHFQPREGPDARVQRITQNVLSRMLSSSRNGN